MDGTGDSGCSPNQNRPDRPRLGGAFVYVGVEPSTVLVNYSDVYAGRSPDAMGHN